MRLGIGSYTFGWATGTYGWTLTQDREQLTPEALIDRAAELEVDLVQICVRPALHEMSGEELANICSYAKERGIQIEVGTKGSDPEQLRTYLEIAKVLEAPLVRTIFTEASPDLVREHDQLKEITAIYEKERIHLAIENHEMYSYKSLAALLERLSCRFIGVCLDTVNSLGRGEGVEEVTEVLLPFTACLHVKDYTVIRGDTDMGFTIVGAAAGQGRLDIPNQLRRLKAANPQASVVLEQWTPFSDTIEQTIALQEQWAERGISYLKTIWSELSL
jgi:sugar phosphate isomerase/epimerase